MLRMLETRLAKPAAAAAAAGVARGGGGAAAAAGVGAGERAEEQFLSTMVRGARERGSSSLSHVFNPVSASWASH